jgi:hypothetical protein
MLGPFGFVEILPCLENASASDSNEHPICWLEMAEAAYVAALCRTRACGWRINRKMLL